MSDWQTVRCELPDATFHHVGHCEGLLLRISGDMLEVKCQRCRRIQTIKVRIPLLVST